jgi:peroxiredoxin
MNKHLLLLIASLLSASLVLPAAESPDVAKAARVKVGQAAPQFEITQLDGKKFSLKEQRGKVVLVNFFATWCGPCVAEMPHLESQIWQKQKDKKFAFISIGREHTADELKPFRAQHKLTFPMAGDPAREVYGLYAEAYIPRTLLIDSTGRIVRQVVGYEEAEFKTLLKSIDEELAKLK